MNWTYKYKITGSAELAANAEQAPPSPSIGQSSWIHHYAQNEEPTDEERTVFQIPQFRLDWLDQKITALNKVAAKLNLEPVGYNVLREWAEPDPSDELGVRQRHFVEIELYGEAPQVKTPGGDTYKFIARLMHGEGGNIIKSIPGVELPEAYRTIEPKCQHCNYKRRRNDTYLLQDQATEQLVQVGSSCLKDFLGHQSANSYAAWAEVLADINLMLLSEDYDEEGWGGGGGRITTYGMERFLAMVYAYIKMFGWMGRATARERGEGIATVDGTLNLYHAKDPKGRELFAQMMGGLNAEDKDMLKAALEWARELKEGQTDDVERLSDYYWNLSLACSSPVVNPATAGIVASLPVAYNKAVLSKIQPSPAVAAGNKGELWAGRGVLEDENIYGQENSYRLRTEDGKIIQWSSPPINQSVGDTLNLEGTIVGYSRYFNNVTTRLARVKILSDEEYEQRSTELGAQSQELGEAPEYAVGEKVTVDVAILKTQDVHTDFGSSTLYVMTDNWGNTLKWFSSGAVAFEQGERLNITGTVKKIDEYKGQPQVMLTRCKVNSREFPEGEEDPRLTETELKATKSQLNKLKRQLKKIQTTVGIEDHRDLQGQTGQVLEPIRQYVNDIMYVVPQGERSLLNAQALIDNHATVGDLISQYLPIAIQKAEERQLQIETERPDSYEATTNKGQIDRLRSRLPGIAQAATEFSQLAAPFLERKQAFEQNLPQMDDLTKQILEIEARIREHRDAVKEWGKRAMSWLTRVV